MADDTTQSFRRARRRVPEDKTAGHFDVEHAERPVLDEMNDVAVKGTVEVGVQGDDNVEFDDQREERRKEDGEGKIRIDETDETDGVDQGLA